MVKVGAEHLAEFDRSGYFVLPAVIPEEHLAVLRRAADEGISNRAADATANTDEREHASLHDSSSGETRKTPTATAAARGFHR